MPNYLFKKNKNKNLIRIEFSHPGEASFSVIIMKQQLSLCQSGLYMHTRMHIHYAH